jgi:ribonuclease HII
MSMNNKEDWISAIIIDDSDDELDDVKDNNTLKAINTKQQVEVEVEEVIEIIPINKKIKKKKIIEPLKYMFDSDTTIIEIGIDEAGRGPMFGRVYAGVAVLPKDDVFDHSQMKDSKKFTSKKKIENVAEYIKENAIVWAVEYEDEQTIDNINILQATQSAMHKGIKNVITQLSNKTDIDYDKILLLVDGNYFKPFSILNKTKTKLESIKCQMVEGGDNKYTSIAAASILAKVSRDKYIEELCIQNPELIERYSIDSNKGYGSKKHMEGIKKYGITKWHRRTFGICKQFS